ncbi:hypothetical protein V1389_12885 [Flavobacterium rakeshii]|uniref:hypothetical protein n=1 Tax=Flavobacterium rakeshii TaxID=1038845 RepID=UPI002E7C28A4|nr:hypothetical protein [Flavobacterium rakeshii]MEE1899242.1 hypothetical protein [Flavobacterium rakeshii]
MKTWILAAVLCVSTSVFAQPGRGEHHEKREKLTVEQRTELQVKKMTLELDLTDKQKADIQKLVLDRNKKAETEMAKHKADREAGKAPTKDERFAMQSKKLDEQIAMKAEMKKVLNDEQFEKWQKMHEKRKDNFKHYRKNLKKEKRR